MMTPQFDLTPFNTMGLVSRALFGAHVTTLSDLETLLEEARTRNLPLYIIGGGSNLLPQESVAAIVGVMAMKGRAITGTAEGVTLVTAQAGEEWSGFVEWTVAQGLGGLENLISIPGTVGAAPIQNIGAYGLELADRFYALTAYDTHDGMVRTFTKGECAFGYRQSYFKQVPGRYIVLDVTFALPVQWIPVLTYAGLDSLPLDVDAATVMARVAALRASKLPDWHVLGNAGSFFHNPVVAVEVADKIAGVPRFAQADGRVKLSAAWLIDACGLKGLRQGPVGVYEQHALILVNYGGGVYSDIAHLSAIVQAAVWERFGVTLVQEPIVL